MALLIAMPSYGANQSKSFTKKYKNERLEKVLNDLCKRNGYAMQILDEMDMDKPITAQFKDARTSSVLKKVLDKEFQATIRHDVLTISRRPLPLEVYTSNDTTYSVQCQWVTIFDSVTNQSAKTQPSNHHLQALVGGGYGGGNIQLRYVYYFTPNWGLGLGVGLAGYVKRNVIDSVASLGIQTDSDGETYEHLLRYNNWQEQQQYLMVDLPIMVQCIYPINSAKLTYGPMKIYADCGVDFGLCVDARRKAISGTIDHIGWYEPWQMEIGNVPVHGYYTEEAADYKEKQPLQHNVFTPGMIADVGVALPVNEDVDVMIGAYMQGWSLWQAGVRVGINFAKRANKIKKKGLIDQPYHREMVCDTTVAVQLNQTAEVEQIKNILGKSIIWFDLNSTEPKLQPADILVQVSDFLKQNPQQKILITGHASKEGDQEINQRLSEQRAQVIADDLIKLGVNQGQIQCQGLGVEVDYINGDHDISLDRRAEITIK